MKKSFIFFLSTLLLLGFVGCNEFVEQDPPHEHQFKEEYANDETNHWHEASCSHDVVSGLENHIYGDDNICDICGYEKIIIAPTHVHVFSSNWSKNESGHFHESMCGHNLISEFSPHDFSLDNICTVCGYEKEIPHTHIFNADWTINEYGHYHASSCGHNLITDFSEHIFGDGNVCLICGYEKIIPHEHTFSDTWTQDELGHYHMSTCDHNVITDYAVHNFGDDLICDICGYEKIILHEHTFSDTWTQDELGHYHMSTCDHNIITDYAVHDFGDDLICDICGYEKIIPHEHTFSDTWTQDELGHYHMSTCEHNIIINYEPHNFGDDLICDICGYEKEEVKLTVIFNSNGGTFINPIKVSKNNLLDKPADPEKLYCEFVGWYIDSDCKVEFDFNNPITEDLILYAMWNQLVEPYDMMQLDIDCTNGRIFNPRNYYLENETATLQIFPNENYYCPLEIEVEGLEDSEWTYDSLTGIITLKVKPNVKISVNCAPDGKITAETFDAFFTNNKLSNVKIKESLYTNDEFYRSVVSCFDGNTFIDLEEKDIWHKINDDISYAYLPTNGYYYKVYMGAFKITNEEIAKKTFDFDDLIYDEVKRCYTITVSNYLNSDSTENLELYFENGLLVKLIDVATVNLIGDFTFKTIYEFSDYGQNEVILPTVYPVIFNGNHCSKTGSDYEYEAGYHVSFKIKADDGYVIDPLTITHSGLDDFSFDSSTNTISGICTGEIVIACSAIES